MMNAPEIIANAKAKHCAGADVSAEWQAICDLWPEQFPTLQSFEQELASCAHETALGTPQTRAALQPVKAADTAEGSTYLIVIRGPVTFCRLHEGPIKRTPNNSEIYAVNV